MVFIVIKSPVLGLVDVYEFVETKQKLAEIRQGHFLWLLATLVQPKLFGLCEESDPHFSFLFARSPGEDALEDQIDCLEIGRAHV